MDTQIKVAARRIVDAIIAKELRVFFEGKNVKHPEDEDAVTIVLRSGKKIRIQSTGHVRRPEDNKLEGSELEFFGALRKDENLAGSVRKMLLTHKFTKRETAKSAAEYAEML